MTLLLSNDEVEAALDMPSCLEAMEVAYRDLGAQEGANGVRCDILTPTFRDDALYSLLTMSGVVPRFGIGAVRINSDLLTWPVSESGARRVKVPAGEGGRYTGLVLLFSTNSGEPLAVYPDGVAQRMRVAAVSGLATKYLARSNAREVALIGTGWQAGAQAMAITTVRNVSCIRCFSPHREKRETFATAMQARLGTQFVAVATAEEAVAGADVVLCATNSLQPVLSAEWLKPGLHISSLSRLELDASVVGAANVVFTHVRNAESRTIRTAGADLAKETDQRKANLAVTIGQTELPELCDLLLGRREGRRSAEDITLFLNYAGLGYQFAATGHVIYTKARALGLGRELDTNLFTSAVPS